MKPYLLLLILFGLIPSANAGIYYHPFYQNGVEIRCDDDEPRHAIFFKNGRAMLFEDDGDEKYKFPKSFLWPEKIDKRYSYFPSTAGTHCSSRELTRKEREFYLKKAKDVCYSGSFETTINFAMVGTNETLAIFLAFSLFFRNYAYIGSNFL